MHRNQIFSLILITLLIVSIGISRRAAIAGSATRMDAQIADLSSNADWYYEDTAQAGAELGHSVFSAGDVNNDGFDDIIFGSPLYTPSDPDGVYREGAAFAFYGGPGGLQTLPDWFVGSGMQASRFGSAVSTAGDINGDGYDDVLVGAEDYKLSFDGIPGVPQSGAAFLYLGSETGLSDTSDWSHFAEAPEISFGHAVASAGDVNNDGFDDILIGARRFEDISEQSNEGKVYLFLGSESGLSAVPDWTYECNLPTATCGSALSSAGDVNNDGFDDIIVGAPGYSSPQSSEGAALIFLGSAVGLSLTANIILESNQAEARFGELVAVAGDVNHDGFSDIVVGASQFDQDEDHPNVGAAFLYLGSLTGPDLNFDWVSFGSEEYSGFGRSVRSAGDINRDNFSDIIVGAYLFGQNGGDDQPDEGAVYLFKGNASGLQTNFSWSAYGNKAETKFGFSAGAAGDVNGDGGDDIIVGAPDYRFDEKTVMGRAFVYLNSMVSNDSHQLFIPLAIKGQ